MNVFINDVPPESAAERLREVPVTAIDPGAAPLTDEALRRKYLVTGGAGYIGSVVSAHLLQAGHAVTVLDDLSTGFAHAVPEGAEFVEGRIQDAARWLSEAPSRGDAPPFDGVLHFAAHSQVGESVQNPAKYWSNNVGGTHRPAGRHARGGRAQARLLLDGRHLRRAAAHAHPGRGAFEAPTNPYGATKLAVDHMISGECRAYGLAAVSLRYFNVAGAHDIYGELHDPESHLIPLVLQVAQGRSGGDLRLRGRLPDPRRHLRPRLHPRRRPRRGPPAGHGGDDGRRARGRRARGRAPDLQPRQRERLLRPAKSSRPCAR